MDPTVQFLWARHRGELAPPADWAMELLTLGSESEALLRLADRNLPAETQDRLVLQALRDAQREELLEPHTLRAAYERESIADYLDGEIDGPTLISRGCDIYFDDPEDDPGRNFWIRIADDSDQHGGQGIYAQYNFGANDFDTVFQDALRNQVGRSQLEMMIPAVIPRA